MSDLGGREGRGANRVRRGDVRAAVLTLLAERDMHGYQIIQELSERSNGVWRPSAGSIYPTLRLLQEQGHIRSRKEGSKRVFAITDYGRRVAQSSGSTEPWQHYVEAEGARVRLRQVTDGLLRAVSQVVSTGTDDEAERAAAIVADARRSIYLALAGEN